MEQTPKPMETGKPRNRTVLYAIIVIILIAVGVGVYYLTQNTTTSPAAVQLTIWDTNGACIQTTSSNPKFLLLSYDSRFDHRPSRSVGMTDLAQTFLGSSRSPSLLL